MRSARVTIERLGVFIVLLPSGLFIACRASTDSAARRMERAGATLVVSPYTAAGHNIADAILRPKLAQFLQNNRCGDIELGEFELHESSPFVGESVRGIGERFPTIVFVAVRSGADEMPTRPGGNQLFAAGDAVAVAGPRSDLEELYLEAERVVEYAR